MKKILILLTLGIFLISLASAETSYCCEKTKVETDGSGGAWCQPAPEDKCDTGNNCDLDGDGDQTQCRKAPTSCESTSYCKLGTCVDSQEGNCMENTPQKVCEETGGVWEDKEADELPQCSLGCCSIGDQAAYVTQTRCKRLSSLYGLEIDFRTSVSSEIACIASATSEVKGACIFEREFERTCVFTSKRECQEMNVGGEGAKFHEGYLCSDESLATNCGPTKQTKCVEGKDEVYLVDTCGNLANIYDASRIEDPSYWSKIMGKAESCGAGAPNANSAGCGNCDYFLGSTCKNSKSGDRNPTYGDNICRDLSCEYEGEEFKHGETWCAKSSGTKDNLPGSRYFRLVCYDGDVSVEACADYRQETCIESDIDGFKTAGCRVNMWQDCISQDNQKDCNNKDRRDCEWIRSSWTPKEGDIGGVLKDGGACVPSAAPGFDFWADGDAQSLCSTASAKCIVKYEKGILSDKECVENCECLSDSWQSNMNDMCTAIGDCGSSKNYLGFAGY